MRRQILPDRLLIDKDFGPLLYYTSLWLVVRDSYLVWDKSVWLIADGSKKAPSVGRRSRSLGPAVQALNPSHTLYAMCAFLQTRDERRFTDSVAEVVKWQTRTFEGRVAQAVRVQVPPSAPN
jgi:hypothetical protein